MFDSIHGRVLVREPARVVLEAAGLGYLLHVPLGTFDALPAVGGEARLLLHLVVREDEWRLYGFATGREREAFRDLLRVSGVGPALALVLLSGLGHEALVDAVRSGDVRALVRVKGVGKKTAERVVVELKERWAAGAGEPVLPAPQGVAGDALRALVALGLEPAEAARRLEALGEVARNVPVADLVRRALRG
ncbi:MAG: Holliday junction branch migration protein RuvA [Planctomycetia bacterium]